MPSEINALVADARRSLRAAGIPPDEAAIDARLLAQHVLGWDAARLLTHGDAIATPEFASAFDALVARRTGREPLAYITGTREFWNLTFVVTPAVLIPRPETELLIETALELLERDQPLRLLDVCTGSGCVAVALAREFARASVTASDISADALDVARRNVARHGLATRVPCIQADLFSGITGTFDAIVTNPPYVPAVDAATLQPEVRRFEPPMALFGGGDGLQIIRRLIQNSVASLTPGGLLLFEIGAGQDDVVRALVVGTRGLTLLDVKRDLQDIPRVAVAQRI
jgi:release factor glutamine methyltransferase